MSRISKQDLDQAYQNGYALGKQHGYEKGKADAMASLEAKRAALQLISAVGQAMQVQASTMQGLTSVLDEMRALK